MQIVGMNFQTGSREKSRK
ncbi:MULTISPECIES: hypothetical protein [unclassified Blautia]